MKYLTLDGLTHYHSRLDNRQRLRDLAIFGTSNFFDLNELYNNGEPLTESDLHGEEDPLLETIIEMLSRLDAAAFGDIALITFDIGDGIQSLSFLKTDGGGVTKGWDFGVYGGFNGGGILWNIGVLNADIEQLKQHHPNQEVKVCKFTYYAPTAIYEASHPTWTIDGVIKNEKYTGRYATLLYIAELNQFVAVSDGPNFTMWADWEGSELFGSVSNNNGNTVVLPKSDMLYLHSDDGCLLYCADLPTYKGSPLVALNPAPEALTESEILAALNGII